MPTSFACAEFVLAIRKEGNLERMELAIVRQAQWFMGRSQDVTGSEERVLEGLGAFFHCPGKATVCKAVKRVAELWVWGFQSQVGVKPVQPTWDGTQAIHIAIQGLGCAQETFHLCGRSLPERSCLLVRHSKCCLNLCKRTPAADTRCTLRRYYCE